MSDDTTVRQLYDALQNDDFQRLRHLLAAGFPVSAVDKYGDSPLYLAALYGAADCLRELLAAGADVHQRNGEYKKTALFGAAHCNRCDWNKPQCRPALCLSLLLAAGASPAQADKDGDTPLDCAVSERNYAACCMLRLAGAGRMSPIMQAVWDADIRTLRSLLPPPPSPLLRFFGKKSPLNQSAEFGYTPLHVAMLPGREACARILLEAGASPHVSAQDGVSPLLMATQNKNTELMQLLLSAGASPKKSDEHGQTALMEAVEREMTDAVKMLLTAGANVNALNHLNRNALYDAVGQPEIMQLLLAAGASPNVEDDYGETPLSHCLFLYTRSASLECARLLIAAGADVNHKVNDDTPLLFEATAKGCEEHLRLLLSAGADANSRSYWGGNALHCAVSAGNVAAVRILLDAGADPAAEDRILGGTPRDCAKGKAARECREVLTEAMRARGIAIADGPVMKVSDIRRKLRRRAVIFHAEKANPAPGGYACRLGQVAWQRPGETWPTDAAGKPLLPLATLFVKDLPAVPESLKKWALITIFAPQDTLSSEESDKPQAGCIIRTYPDTEGLIPCDYAAFEFTPCLLTPKLVKNDMPKFPDCGGSDEIWDHIREAERVLGVDYQDDISEADYQIHKIGGYPTYIQDAPELPGGYAFVLQICTDTTAGFSIGDGGNYYFFYNSRKNDWRVHVDCY